MQSRFGCGFLFGTPQGGSPIMFAALQNVSVDFSQDLKLLYGSSKFALEQAGGKAKIDCKADVGRIDPVLFNSIYWGGTQTTGVTLGSMAEAATIPAVSGPYTITAANGATFKTDLGVYDIALGSFLKWVASGPTTGQYTVNTVTGVYTFAAADAGRLVSLYYTYTATTGGITITGTNQTLGSVISFQAVLQHGFAGKQSVLTLFKCISNKLSMPFKQDDFLLPGFTFSAQDDGTGNVFAYSSQT